VTDPTQDFEVPCGKIGARRLLSSVFASFSVLARRDTFSDCTLQILNCAGAAPERS